jgi:uncharacterized protein (TIGR03083 family)
MDVDEHLEILQSDGVRLADAAAAARPDDTVPSCPDWVVRDLVQHQGAVHRWATGSLQQRWEKPWTIPMEEVVGTWPDDADLVGWFREGHAGLVDALQSAPDDLECWSFMPAPSPRAFWARRQAHETAIHRVDAELAAGRALSAETPAFGADGLDELLAGFAPRRPERLATEDPVTLAVACSDVDAAWVIRTDPEGATIEAVSGDAVGGTGTDCTVRGGAVDLYYALWHRTGSVGLDFEGDAAAFGRFLDLVHIRMG